MSDPDRKHRLDGLEPDNLLAFLALLGLLRCLETARSGWHPRIAWSLDDPPLRPLLFLSEAQSQTSICEAAAEGAISLAEDYSFPCSTEGDAAAQKDLNYDPLNARKLLTRSALSANPRSAAVWSALMCDAAAREDKIEATPLCALFGQGHQHFLDRLATVPSREAPPPRGRGKKATSISAAETLHEALFQPWTRQDPTPAFRWDPAEDVRYALRADDPSGDKSTTQHGANRLAAFGLAVLTTAPEQRGERVRLRILGGGWVRNEFAFSWPVWKDPASLAGIRALLGHPSLNDGPAALAHLGVVEVRQTRRISVGKFMNFTRAMPISN
jgi:hypothetical protein